MQNIKDSKNNKDILLVELCDKNYSNVKNNLNVIRGDYPMFPYYILSLKTAKEETEPIPTGINNLDNVLNGGLRPGLYIFGANPGLGKTSLMLHIALNMAINKQHCVYFNLEMSVFQITTRLLANFSYRNCLTDETKSIMNISQLSKSSLYNQQTGKFDTDLVSLYESCYSSTKEYLHFINYSEENDCRSIDTIEITLNNCKKCHNMAPVVIIDFLQLLKMKLQYTDYDVELKDTNVLSDKRLQIDAIIEELKKFSNRYKVPILAISSLSRGAYTKEDTVVSDYCMSAFKESGHIEYTADFLVLLTRGEDNINFESADTKNIYLNVLKNRYGKTNQKIKIEFIPENAFFRNDEEEK
jgi:replicative DNA helicase